MNPKDKKIMWNIVLAIGIVAIVSGILLITNEVGSAKKFCSSIDGKYSLKVFPLPVEYYCNNQTIIQFTDGWGFQGNITEWKDFKLNISSLP